MLKVIKINKEPNNELIGRAEINHKDKTAIVRDIKCKIIRATKKYNAKNSEQIGYTITTVIAEANR